MNKVESFNKKMDKLFHTTPGAWHGNMPEIEPTGHIRFFGNIALDPEKSAYGVLFLARKFDVTRLEVGEPEPNGVRPLICSFALKEREANRLRGLPRYAIISEGQP